jgi:hypothetical protein
MIFAAGGSQGRPPFLSYLMPSIMKRAPHPS